MNILEHNKSIPVNSDCQTRRQIKMFKFYNENVQHIRCELKYYKIKYFSNFVGFWIV